MALLHTGVVVLDCAEPAELAEFYRRLLGAEEGEVSLDRVDVEAADGTRIAFRRDATVTPPSWPRPDDSFQAHLEFLVPDLDAAEREIIGLGGRILELDDSSGSAGERVCADPAGHTFTLRQT
ncbi:VOC family protein [Streptomyces sp. NPDC091377]|uniref:VOC family protein n=1 Tax=unclassified Streptomyces TaxID=2593676 RepID=UPI00382D027D